MTDPPAVPNRQREQEPQPDTPTIAASPPVDVSTTKVPPRLPPRQKVGVLNVVPDTPVNDQAEPGTNTTDTSQPTTETSAPRFVAPSPASPTSHQSAAGNALRTLLNLFPSQRQDTPEEAIIRRQLEEEQIARYMNSFSKHVQYLRIDPDSMGKKEPENAGSREGGIRRKPNVEDFRAAAGPVVDDERPVFNPEMAGESGGKEADVHPVEAEEMPVDWFGYYAAVSHLDNLWNSN